MSLWANERVTVYVCDILVEWVGWSVLYFHNCFFSLSLRLVVRFIYSMPPQSIRTLSVWKTTVKWFFHTSFVTASAFACCCCCNTYLLCLELTYNTIESESVFSACVACINLKYKNKRWTTTVTIRIANECGRAKKREKKTWNREICACGCGHRFTVGMCRVTPSILTWKKCWPFRQSVIFFSLNIHFELFQIDYLRTVQFKL